MCSEFTPRAPIPDTRIPQLMQPCRQEDPNVYSDTEAMPCLCFIVSCMWPSDSIPHISINPYWKLYNIKTNSSFLMRACCWTFSFSDWSNVHSLLGRNAPEEFPDLKFVTRVTSLARVKYCWARLEYCWARVKYCWARLKYCWAWVKYCWARVKYCWANVKYL